GVRLRLAGRAAHRRAGGHQPIPKRDRTWSRTPSRRPAIAPLRAQAKASEAMVAATTMINAYSVVWLPLSRSTWSGAMPVTRDRVVGLPLSRSTCSGAVLITGDRVVLVM